MLTGTYKTILADPPWPYTSSGPVGTGGRGGDGSVIDKSRKIKQVSASAEYPLMSIKAICSLPVKEWSDSDAHLYLWTTNSFVEQAHVVARAWGFRPITLLTWVKVQSDGHTPSMKTGYYFRSASEHILFCVRGSLRLLGSCRPTVF